MNNILLIGNYGSSNIGDETILKGVAEKIIDALGSNNVLIHVPTRNTGFVKKYHQELRKIIMPFYIYDFSSLLKVSKKCGTLVIGGGGIWSGYTGPLAKLIPVFALFAKAAGKKVIFKSFGLYDTAASSEKFLVNLSAYFADGCSVRDKESYENLWASVQKKATVVDDCAIHFLRKLESNPKIKETYLKMAEENSQYKRLGEYARSGKRIMGFSVKPLKNRRNTERVINAVSGCINLLDRKYKEKICFVFFPFAKTDSLIEDDVKMIKAIVNKAADKNSIIVLEHDNPIVYYFAIKHNVEKFIGMRYHSLIFSSIANTPFLAIPYENKVIEFLKNIGYNEFVELDRVTRGDLVKFIECGGAKKS